MTSLLEWLGGLNRRARGAQLVLHQVPSKHAFVVSLLLPNNLIKNIKNFARKQEFLHLSGTFTCLKGNILSRSQQASLGSIYDPFPQSHGSLGVHNSPGTVHSLLEHRSPATVFVHMFLCVCLHVSMYGSCVPTSCITVCTCVPRV